MSWYVNPTDSNTMMNSQQNLPNSQAHFHSIWSASQNTSSNSQFRMENSFQSQQQKYVGVRPMDSFGSQPMYGTVNNHNNNYYYSGNGMDVRPGSQSQSQSQANKENAMQRHEKCKKTFAGLFQSTTDAQTNHSASFLGEANGTGNNYKPPAKQREDMVRYSYLTKRYHSDMQSLGNYRSANDSSANAKEAMPDQSLAMQEMNERIQTVTKMLMNMNTDLTSKLTDLDADVKSQLKGMHALVSEKYHEIKDIAQENQYLVKQSASKQERYYSLSQEQRREVTKDSKISLWSREPESYLHTSKFEPEQNADLTGNDTRKPVNEHVEKAAPYDDDSDEVMDSKTNTEERELESPKEKKPQEKGETEPEGSELQNNAKESIDAELQQCQILQDHLSITSEDEIEDDFGDLSQEDPGKMTHCIRKRISRYLDSQQYQTSNKQAHDLL